jgi:hypothetical protein
LNSSRPCGSNSISTPQCLGLQSHCQRLQAHTAEQKAACQTYCCK